METKSISSCAMLVNLHVGVWTARKKDKQTEAEVRADKNAQSTKATSVHKHLLADAEPLMAVARFSAECRLWKDSLTLPWGDDGSRMLPTAGFFTFKQEAAQREHHFWQLVKVFEREYPTLITSMALQLGKLFDRSEYPDPRDVASKFHFRIGYTPVPEAGDFRVDLPADALKELRASYEEEKKQAIQDAMKDAWNRLHKCIAHMHDKLVPSADGKTKRIHETMLLNANELCSVLSSLNITNDPKLEEARKKLEVIVQTVDTTALREVEEVRESVKTKLDAILDKFNI